MTRTTDENAGLLRQIPAVDQMLLAPQMVSLCAEFPREAVVAEVRRQLLEIRRDIRLGLITDASYYETLANVPFATRQAVEKTFSPSLRRIINATGVVLHTNLGRAPLATDILDRAREVASGYSNLEFDLERNERGRRDVHAEGLLRSLMGCEAALVVNNCAAAVLLALNSLAEGGEVIVSRGELVEIGGSFRVPDIMRKSGAVLREVGTTNRTRLSDYARAINSSTKLILRVHRSNFRLIGFSEQPALDELAHLAHRKRLPLFEDLGSGCLVDLSAAGITDEPTVQESLKAGIDIVAFSGDKLLGGPQAGLLVGRKKHLQLLRANPLYRALRVDKLTLATMEATLSAYQRGKEKESIPSLQMIFETEEALRHRAEAMLQRVKQRLPAESSLSLTVVKGCSVIGGGSTPGREILTMLIAIHSTHRSAQNIEKFFRSRKTPILIRVEGKKAVVDLRTVLPAEEEAIEQALVELDGV